MVGLVAFAESPSGFLVNEGPRRLSPRKETPLRYGKPQVTWCCSLQGHEVVSLPPQPATDPLAGWCLFSWRLTAARYFAALMQQRHQPFDLQLGSNETRK